MVETDRSLENARTRARSRWGRGRHSAQLLLTLPRAHEIADEHFAAEKVLDKLLCDAGL